MTDQLSFKNKYRNWADSGNGLPMSSGLACNYRVTAETSKGGSADSIGSSEKLATRLALKKDSLKGWVLWQQRVSADAAAGSSNSLAQETQPADLNSLRRGWMYRQSGQSKTLVTRLKESAIVVTPQLKEVSGENSSNWQSDNKVGFSDYVSLHLLTEVSDIGATRARSSGRTIGRSTAAQKQKTSKLAVLPAGWQSPFYTGQCQYAIAPKEVSNSNSVTSNKVDATLGKPQNTLTLGLSLIHPAESIINSVQQTTVQKTSVASKVTSDSEKPQLIRGRSLRTMRGKLQNTLTAKAQASVMWRKGSESKSTINSTLRLARKSRVMAGNQQKSVSNKNGNAGSLISLCGSLGYLPERESLAYVKAQQISGIAKGGAATEEVVARAKKIQIVTPSQRQPREALYYGGIKKADSSKRLKQSNSLDVRLASLSKVQVATRQQPVTDNSNSVRLSSSTGLLHSFPYNLAIKQKYAVSNESVGSQGSEARTVGKGQSKWHKAGGKQLMDKSSRIVILSEKAVYASCVLVTTALLKQLSAKKAV